MDTLGPNLSSVERQARQGERFSTIRDCPTSFDAPFEIRSTALERRAKTADGPLPATEFRPRRPPTARVPGTMSWARLVTDRYGHRPWSTTSTRTKLRGSSRAIRSEPGWANDRGPGGVVGLGRGWLCPLVVVRRKAPAPVAASRIRADVSHSSISGVHLLRRLKEITG